MNPEINPEVPLPSTPPPVSNVPLPDNERIREKVLGRRGDGLVDAVNRLMVQHAEKVVALHAKDMADLKSAFSREHRERARLAELLGKLRDHVAQQRRYVGLAVRVLARSARSKKKGPANRQALGVLEASLSEPEPGVPFPPWPWLGAVLATSLAMFAFVPGAYARAKMAQ